MPLYEYECAACGHRFERIQKFSDPLVDVCPSCAAGPVHKLLSAPAIQFKGTGWYVTDYAGKKGNGSPGSSLTGSKDAKDKSPAATPPAPSADSASTPSSASTSSGEGSKPSASPSSGSSAGSSDGGGSTKPA
jgi:putative FmdB family regulatory protein